MGPGTDLSLEPIGVVRSPFADRKAAPRQPAAARGVTGTIELREGCGFADALADLDRFSHLWVVSVFHLNLGEGWRPKVQPPRESTKRGVFATRAPRRPNPIGLSLVRLERIDGLVLHVRDLDLVDGTPVLDLKPYVPYADAAPDATHGWLEEPADPRPDWEVRFAPRAEEQLAFLAREHGVELREPLRRALAVGPQPHAYRRIRREGPGYRIALEAWRARFEVQDDAIVVQSIHTGYRPRQLATDEDPALDAHRGLSERFGVL